MCRSRRSTRSGSPSRRGGRQQFHEIALDTYGARGSGDEEFNYVVGMAGSGVEKVVVHDHGKTVQATLQGGRWTAWWPDGQPEGLLTGTFTVTFTDGANHTVTAKSLTDKD